METSEKRLEALQQTEPLKHAGLSADTRLLKRRCRRGWSRGLPALIGLFGLLASDIWTTRCRHLLQPSTSCARTEPSRHITPLGRYGQLPLSFEANQGQSDSQVQFLAHGQGYTLFLTTHEAVFALLPPASLDSQAKSARKTGTRFDTPATAPAVVRMQLLGANPVPQVMGLEKLSGKANYFRGNDPRRWQTNVPTYGRVKYADVYPGVDLVYYGQSRQLEDDFVVASGADPDAITFGFEGVDQVDMDAQGNLMLATASGSFQFHKPVVYQEGEGQRYAITASYVLKGSHQVGFDVGNYDRARPLIIDPILSYSTYLGGSGSDAGVGIAVDVAGQAYLTGTTNSSDFPTVRASQPAFGGGGQFGDAFVAKLMADGSGLIYATYLGGNSRDEAGGIAVDAAGAAYVTGFTDSLNFPTVNPIQPTLQGGTDAFVAKLTTNGSILVYSTYLGGSSFEGLSIIGPGSIAVDATGSAYVTGSTSSPDFPTARPLQSILRGGSNAYVAKLTVDGSTLLYATYLGGSGEDGGAGIAVDVTGSAYVTGRTTAFDFPAVNPLQPALRGSSDGFMVKLTPDGSHLVYSTYLGGSGGEEGVGIAVDGAGSPYVMGITASPDFPVVRPLQPALRGMSDVFVAKLTADGSALVYATYLGGSGSEGLNGGGGGIGVGVTGAAYVTGITQSPDFPTVNPLQPTPGGVFNAFVAKLTGDGSALVYATYLGGGTSRSSTFSFGLAVDGAGSAYVTGATNSPDFFTVSPLQPALGGSDGNDDAFVAKLVEVMNRCPQGYGFWMTHAAAWPVTSLILGSQTYAKSELVAILDIPIRGDASLILAHQLIAAKLNLANGSDSTPVSVTVEDADRLLSSFAGKLPYHVEPTSTAGQRMLSDAAALESYNNGKLTPDCTP